MFSCMDMNSGPQPLVVRVPLPFVGVSCMGAVAQIGDLDSASGPFRNSAQDETIKKKAQERKFVRPIFDEF